MRTVLITGAGSGFGRLTAVDPARLGHHVIAGVQIRLRASELRAAAREAVQPGFDLTAGFNDTAIEASSWYDEATALLPGWQPPSTPPGQEDPQAMVGVMIAVITGASSRYRNAFPPSMEAETRAVQAAAWEVSV